MKFLGQTKIWLDYDMQLQLSWYSQGLLDNGFNLGDAFSKSLSIYTKSIAQSLLL